jgi:hypothetical protein
VAEENDSGSRRPHLSQQLDEQCDGVLGDDPVEDKLEDISRGIRDASVGFGKAGCFGVMTNHEALMRLSVDKNDSIAVTSLRENNAQVIRTTVGRYFGTGKIADNAEFALMQRVADHARSYEDSEDPDAWLARCTNAECDRLRNEAVHDKANRD